MHRGRVSGKHVLVSGLIALISLAAVHAGNADLVITGVQMEGGGARLLVGCPDGFTNRLDVFASTNLVAGSWVLVSQDIPAAGTNTMSWFDSGAAQLQSRFYLVGDAGLDSDADGLPDAREGLIHGTDPLVADTDTDGIPDGAEISRGTDPGNGGSGAVTLYADSQIGDNALDGLSASVGPLHGPKRSISSAYASAYTGDTLCMAGGAAFEEPLLCLGARSVVLCPSGAVTLRP